MQDVRLNQIDVIPTAENVSVDNPEILVLMCQQQEGPPQGTRSAGGFGERVQIEVGEQK